MSALLQTASYRRSVVDQMMWQVPVLSLTAQSFLLTIAFGSGGRVGRVVAGVLAAIAAIAAVQLLLKHRYHEETASHALERLERDYLTKDYGLPILDGPPRGTELWAWPGGSHAWEEISGKNRAVRLAQRSRRCIARPRSYLVWTYTLVLFAAADAISALVIGLGG